MADPARKRPTATNGPTSVVLRWARYVEELKADHEELDAGEARELAAELFCAAQLLDPHGVWCLHCMNADHSTEAHDDGAE